MTRRLRRSVSAVVAVLVLLLAAADAVYAAGDLAQLTLPTAAPLGAVPGIVQQGLYATAPIVLDGSTLFRIAAPINAPIAQLPISMRVANVQTALADLLVQQDGAQSETVYDPKTIRVHTRHVGDVAVLEAVDEKHRQPSPIVSVTTTDARANGSDVDSLASDWQDTLQSALVRALELREPAAQQRNVQSVTRLGIVLVIASLGVAFGVRALWQTTARLEAKLAVRDNAVDAQVSDPVDDVTPNVKRRRLFALKLRRLAPAQRLWILSASAETLLWALALAWFVAITWSLSLFAETTPLSQTIARAAIGVAATVIIAGLLNRILDALIAQAAGAWRMRSYANSEDRARLHLRIPTISRAVAGAKTFLLVFVAVLSALGQLGVPIGSVVTIGGLAAVALSLAAQNFVRDFLNGFLVLFEDQYVVGDFVTINSYNGLVERLTLRMVQIRDAAGDVITIPHSSVVNVVNQSRNWSRVDYHVPVDPAADIPRAVTIVTSEIAELATHGDWAQTDDPIEWIGIDGLSRDAIVIRASVRTAPLRQFDVRRDLNERVRAAFARAGIGLGAPPPP